MIFKAPWMLLALLILPLIGKLLLRAEKQRSAAVKKLSGSHQTSPKQIHKRMAQRLAIPALIILALAQPAWNPHAIPAGVQGRDLVIALDISRSMLAADVFPSRLDAAKIALFESLDALRGQRLGLITFAGSASVRVPLTLDHSFVRYMLDRAAPSDANIGSTSLQAAIEKAIDVALRESKEGQQDLIIFTDGEDLISNIETTAEELRACGARVLIIGIGDPTAGAHIPDIEDATKWMQYKGSNVVTRLDEAKLLQLSESSPNVIYYPARTKPFDLISIYRQMLADTADLPVSDETRTVYTEGYPFLLALAGLLLILPNFRWRHSLIAILLFSGCAPDSTTPDSRFQEMYTEGRTLWAAAQTSIETDPHTSLAQMTEAREAFLRAALIKPGETNAAAQIAGISAQMHSVQQMIKEQKEQEEDLQQKLQAAIEQLAELTQRETALSQQAQKLLRKRPPASAEEKTAATPPVHEEQTEIKDGTTEVSEVVAEVQKVVQNMLKMAYGEIDQPPPTEFDEALAKLTQATENQTTALDHLSPENASWPQVSSAQTRAARQMQEALAILAGQNNAGNEDQESSEEGDMSDWDFDEEMEWDESMEMSDMSMPISSQNFKAALENRSLPMPNYTVEEIMAEEAANQEKRAQQQSSRAGAGVEKNW